MEIHFRAYSIKEYKNKIEAVKALDLNVLETTLRGYLTRETLAEEKENIETMLWCDNRNGTKNTYQNGEMQPYYNDIVSIGREWITIENGDKYRFTDYKWENEDAYIRITCEYD